MIRQLKTSYLSADNFGKKSSLGESTPEPAIWSCNSCQRIPYFDSCQLTTTWFCNIRLQAPTLGRRPEILHWLPCGADGPTFLGWTDNQIFLAMGLRSRTLCVRVQLRYKGQSTQIPSQAREFKLHIKPITKLFHVVSEESLAFFYVLLK